MFFHPLPSSPNLEVSILTANDGLSSKLLLGSSHLCSSTLYYFSTSNNFLFDLLDVALANLLPNLAFLNLSMNTFTGPICPVLFAQPHLSSHLFKKRTLMKGIDEAFSSIEPKMYDLSLTFLTINFKYYALSSFYLLEPFSKEN